MRVALLVIDSFGIGSLPDAQEYGDENANTALHICEADPAPKWENLQKWGLGNACQLLGHELPGCESVKKPLASFAAMKEVSPGKDTTTGHWELSGIQLEKAFPTFNPQFPSFPEALVQDFIKETGCKNILGNKAASGTEIIAELGQQHLDTGFPICYTSADSVFQIACHSSLYSVEELYHLCRVARKLCDAYNVGRVIARPFEGPVGDFVRTKDRLDFSYSLPEPSILDHLQANDVRTIAVGKIASIFNDQGIDVNHHDSGNPACLQRTQELLATPADKDEFIFVNLVDTDMIYGHRRDPAGYQQAVQAIDDQLPALMKSLKDTDYLIITADHGCDPTYKGSDHTREYVPLLVYNPKKKAADLGIRDSFADVAQTLATLFHCPPYPRGSSI